MLFYSAESIYRANFSFLILFTFVPLPCFSSCWVLLDFAYCHSLFEEPASGFLVQFFDLHLFSFLPFAFWIYFVVISKFLSWIPSKLTSSLFPQIQDLELFSSK